MVTECHNDADAPLIASAPDLLDIAEELLADYESHRLSLGGLTDSFTEGSMLTTTQRMDAIIAKASAIIAKAHGEPA